MTFSAIADHIRNYLDGSPFSVEQQPGCLSMFDSRDFNSWVADIVEVSPRLFAVKSWNCDLQQPGLEGPLDAIARLEKICVSQDKMIRGVRR